MNEQTPLMTIREVQGYLKVSRSTVIRMITHGQLKADKLGAQWRVHPDSVREVEERIRRGWHARGR